MPQCDGPYSILDLQPHTAILGDALTGAVAFGGKPVSIARLVKFSYPSDHAFPTPEELSDTPLAVKLEPGDYVAVAFKKRVHVACVDRVFPEQNQLRVVIHEVPSDCRFGPWSRRRWEIRSVGGQPQTEVIPNSEVVCRVTLINGALDQDSLERLAARGLATGAIPTRDKAIVSTFG